MKKWKNLKRKLKKLLTNALYWVYNSSLTKGEFMRKYRNKNLLQILGLLLVVGGIALGVWLGVFVMFIGGLAQIIQSFQSNPFNAIGIASGVARFFLSGLVGWMSFMVVGGIGVSLLKD